jgi:cell division protein FtsB
MGNLQEAAMISLQRRNTVLVAFLFLLVGAAFLTQVVPYRQIIDSKHRVESARAQLASLQAENVVLQASADALQTDEEVEKLAREKLGYVMPGETAFVVLDPPSRGETAPVAEALPEVPEKTWVDRIWDFITGSDVAG